MKNYFMLTYIWRLFSPSVTCRRFSSILKALKPILYVCRSAYSIELRLKYQHVVGKVWQEEANSLLMCRWAMVKRIGRGILKQVKQQRGESEGGGGAGG